MPFQSIEPRRLYRQIADQIRTLIRSGEFPAGARLPPERDLARQLGVSRPSVREALIALEVEGLVEVRIGSGIYVQAPGATAAGSGGGERRRRRRDGRPVRAAARALCDRGRDARRWPRSPRRRRRSQAIEEALEAMQHEFDGDRQPLDGDRLFHLRIAEATGNGALVAVVECCGRSAPARSTSSSSTITIRRRCGRRRWPSTARC